MSATDQSSWRVACESGDWFPTMDDYSPIPATFENAARMAAAPDLIKALELFLEQGDSPVTREKARAAIALAVF